MNPLNQLKEKKSLVVDSTRITIKLVIIIVLTLLLLIPQLMVKDLIRERGNRQRSVTNNIAQQIGGEQDIVGPILTIPYLVEVEKTILDSKGNFKGKELVKEREYLYISPEKLSISSNVQVENKEKSIYKVPVFQSENKLNVQFGALELKNESLRDDLQFSEAFLIIATSGNKGIIGQPTTTINEASYEFEPGIKTLDLAEEGIHLPIDANDVFEQQFTINLGFRGTSSLNFASIAKANELVMESNWAHPNFETSIQNGHNNKYVEEVYTARGGRRGNSLPLDDSKEITDKGFKAKWQESQFGINHKSQWTSNAEEPNLYGRMMGTKFINVADYYNKTDRSIKYMALIIGLVFISFFIIELIKGQRVHPFQYVMVGASIVVFFVLLLAISEYLGFNISYILASIATASLVGLYSLTMFQNKNVATSITMLLLFLFTFIFVILIAVEYSLLIGAIGLFIILAIIMYVTRNIKWYNE